MRSGWESGVRCDNQGLVANEERTFEGLYDSSAGWHDKKDGKSEKRDKGIVRGGGEMVDGRDRSRARL